MMRLIDGAKFRAELNQLDCIDKFGYVVVPITKINIALERSTVDAVPVVRCRDCELCEYEKRSDGDWHPWCLHFGGDVDEDDYCSYGERKDETEEPK